MPDGQASSAVVIRSSINQRMGSLFGTLAVAAAGKGAYIVSSWQEPMMQVKDSAPSSEIARVDADGKLIWKTEISSSFVVDSDKPWLRFCTRPSVVTLLGGDAMVACELEGKIHTHRFNQTTGGDTADEFSLPECNDGHHPVALSLFVRPDGGVLISGTRPEDNIGPGCSWLARMPS